MGAGASDHVTFGPAVMVGPDELTHGQVGTYMLSVGPMTDEGDVWLYQGAVTVAGEPALNFSDDGVPIPCS